MRKRLAGLMMAMSLTGCATVSEQVRINDLPPTHLLERCPDLPEAVDGSPESLFRNHIETRGYYERCRERFQQLQDHVISAQEKAQNKK